MGWKRTPAPSTTSSPASRNPNLRDASTALSEEFTVTVALPHLSEIKHSASFMRRRPIPLRCRSNAEQVIDVRGGLTTAIPTIAPSSRATQCGNPSIIRLIVESTSILLSRFSKPPTCRVDPMCVIASSDTNRLMDSASEFSARRIFILRPNENKMSCRERDWRRVDGLNS